MGMGHVGEGFCFEFFIITQASGIILSTSLLARMGYELCRVGLSGLSSQNSELTLHFS